MNLQIDLTALDKLKEKMNARTEPELDMRLRVIGENLNQNNIKIEDGIPIVNNRKVVLYIRSPRDYHRYRKLPRYHILHCQKIIEMKENEEYYKYFATTRTDGNFLLKLTTNNELSLEKLVLCKLCLNKLRSQYGWSVFDSDPEKFPLEDWFEPFLYFSEDWQVRSQACRESANWTCQECNINLESDRFLLHAHHKWGTRYNDQEDLIALCIACHAKQPGGGHQMLSFYPNYNEFITSYGEIWRELSAQKERIRDNQFQTIDLDAQDPTPF